MLHAYLGHDTFRTALQQYQAKHQYANAVTADLWAALSAASQQDVATLANSWTRQMGYPLVQASFDRGTKTLTLKQRRFFADGTQGALSCPNSLVIVY